ncbi:hypothetical protein A1Q2_08461 [Trichosporon asahii var. asahii CBS 8904]|uniref:F-box domain-containing protein n=2 Tax=Trichosporon asahii var. asahii TaxID=189963 RepID=K1W646_TRIAC|nr:hypothetical protein A1Q1_01132 [Trichosporon asahii var. asahii CBS 2479]EJT49710.1 hypothetical protein A1Q1_01132 [Trichosporon asahii var. asahii CBS 2479]EKC97243.1 hypothetical protein A1Q2_08461 [Trichosporon asahii var. asahii CBS 8904]
MTVIDHRFYPHIIDQIWTHLSVGEVERLRQVCKCWSIRADLSISNRLTIARKECSTPPYEIRARLLDNPSITSIITEEVQNGCVCLFLEGDNSDSEGRTRLTLGQRICRFCNRLDDSLIIDVVGFAPSMLDMQSAPLEALCHDARVRWLTDFSHLPECHLDLYAAADYVFFLQYNGYACSRITFDFNAGNNYSTFDFVDLVFNFDCHANPTTSTSSNVLLDPTGPAYSDRDCLTFVFHHKMSQLSKSPSNPAFLVGLLQCYRMPEVHVCFVGLDSFIETTEALRSFERAVFRGFVEYRVKFFSGEMGREACEEMCETDWDLVTFLTMEEYKTKVGPEQFLINTVK